ncbi:MAG: C25 family cysteine peptidase [Candidatus Fermentibacteria bacterium]
MTVIIMLAVLGAVSDGIVFEPAASLSDLSVDTMIVDGKEYHLISMDGFSSPASGIQNPGHPSLPSTISTFLLPPDIKIDTIEITSSAWTALPGKYYLYPVQTGLMSDPVFISPDPAVYSSGLPFPEQPVEVSRQGSAMGYSVVSLTGTPVRYIPADSTLMILTSIELIINTEPSDMERIVPNRETEWSAAMRERGILSLVSNPENITCYSQPALMTFGDRLSPLNVTQSPCTSGDGVDMVIVTGSDLADDFEQVADYRTRQGIITVVRTEEWIDQHYSGSDTPERIRNFLRDAHEEWGIQAVLLGGDDGVVPVRQCYGWNYNCYPYPMFQMPSDDYYCDLDGSWSHEGSMWIAEFYESYLDLCGGRWPVNSSDDVDLLFAKLLLYEQPEDFPEGFARKLLLMGSNDSAGAGADQMIGLSTILQESSAVPQYLDEPTELYFPHSLPGGDLCRNTALIEFDQGYNLIIHADHSEIHKLATAGKNTLGQHMWDSDFATMGNFEEPSILWTLGCDIGHFDGAYCFAEAGLLTSPSSGLLAMITNARYGLFDQYVTYYAFCDALFNTGHIGIQPDHWPLSYLGEAHRCSKNNDGISFLQLNFLGSPLIYVWRDDPQELSLIIPRILLIEGVPRDIPVTVTDGSDPVENATVCLWKKDEVFSLQETDEQGQVIFEDVCIVDGSGDQDLTVTAVKRRREIDPGTTSVESYIPSQVTMDVFPAGIPILAVESFSVDAEGDSSANPGETVDIFITASNSGGEPALNVSAELYLVTGSEYINSIPDNRVRISNIDPDHAAISNDPFTVTINAEVESYSTAEFKVLLSYADCLGNFYQRESSLLLTVYSEGYMLTVLDPTASNSSGAYAEITLSDMFLANCGLGEGNSLEITVDNLIPPESFLVGTLTSPGIESNRAAALTGQLVLSVTPLNESSPWLSPTFRGCSFDLAVSSNGGDFIARHVDVEMVAQLQEQQIDPPSEVNVYDTGQDFISLTWKHQGQTSATGFYIYYNDGTQRQRAFPLPVPVQQITLEGLLPGTQYSIEITAIDTIGRESDPAQISISTTCPAVSGWPIQLAGSPGGGPAIADLDQDGSSEIIVAASFGLVYIIDRSGAYQMLSPPSGYDFDRFLGCAVGDVDGDPMLEIVVTCQKKIDAENQEQVAVLIYDLQGTLWTVNEVAVTGVNQQAASPMVAGTPVLFQADSSTHMEIALRTKGHFGELPHLYVWQYDSVYGNWVDYSPDFPLALGGTFYSAPAAVDFDGDGFEELIITTWGSGGTGTALKIVDFESGGAALISTHQLPELDIEGETARVFGTLAAAEENDTYYIAGSAKTNVLSSVYKQVFAYIIQSDPVDLTFVWTTNWMNGEDFCSNMPGPSIGDLDGDSNLEVVYTLNGGQYYKEAILYGWGLKDGAEVFQSSHTPFNPLIPGGGTEIKSQAVVGLTTGWHSEGMAVFSGFSSLCCGHDPSSGSSMLEGFPAWTRDIACAAPAICDLDMDGSPEILYIDYSGFATLFNWNDGSYTTDGWHMYQDNPLRNGFYNTPDPAVGLDISISGNPYISAPGETDGFNFSLISEVEISGTIPPIAEDITRINRSNAPSSAAPVTPCRIVEIAAFRDDCLIGSTTIGLEEGSHLAVIPLRYINDANRTISVIADPFNEYSEIDEINNISAIEVIAALESVSEVVIPSPAGSIELNINLPSTLPEGLKIRLYSIDGRLLTAAETETLDSGWTSILLGSGSGDQKPAPGMYVVCIEGLGSEDVIRKVIILDR